MKIAAVRLACHYQRCWQDGFGARGWKLASAIGDPEVIASTAATGERIRTSVFVHDILDHVLCGLPHSGHRNEAVALVQLARRTGADPTPDFVQMVEEDLLQGRIIGESLVGFLPADLVSHLAATDQDGRAIITALQAVLGKAGLRERLIARFFELGEAGAAQAAARYAAHRLDYDQRGALGLALQGLLEHADAFVCEQAQERASGCVWQTAQRCGFEIAGPVSWSSQTRYPANWPIGRSPNLTLVAVKVAGLPRGAG